jgi:hypothetical protein
MSVGCNVIRKTCIGQTRGLSRGSTDGNRWKVYRRVGEVLKTAGVNPASVYELGFNVRTDYKCER